jgi:hypothetical protein
LDFFGSRSHGQFVSVLLCSPFSLSHTNFLCSSLFMLPICDLHPSTLHHTTSSLVLSSSLCRYMDFFMTTLEECERRVYDQFTPCLRSKSGDNVTVAFLFSSSPSRSARTMSLTWQRDNPKQAHPSCSPKRDTRWLDYGFFKLNKKTPHYIVAFPRQVLCILPQANRTDFSHFSIHRSITASSFF